MDRSDLQVFITKLQGLYPNKFPGLSSEMARVWLDGLATVDEDVAEASLMRWARHHTFHPPSLDELLEQVEIVRDERRALKRAGSSTTTYLDTLKDAAETQASNPLRSPDDATYGRLMARLAERSISGWVDGRGQWHEKMTLEERGAQCYAWAQHYAEKRPQLAEDLRAAGRSFGTAMYLAQGVEHGTVTAIDGK